MSGPSHHDLIRAAGGVGGNHLALAALQCNEGEAARQPLAAERARVGAAKDGREIRVVLQA
jgi:hypothetical protein